MNTSSIAVMTTTLITIFAWYVGFHLYKDIRGQNDFQYTDK